MSKPVLLVTVGITLERATVTTITAGNEESTLYFEEQLDIGCRKQGLRLYIALVTPLPLVLDYLLSLAGDPFEPAIWLYTLPVMVLSFVFLPEIAFWPNPYIRVIGANLEIRILRIPPRKIPLQSIWKLEAGYRRGKGVVEINRTSFLSGDRISTSRPHEMVDAIERAKRELRADDLRAVREESPGFRSDAEFEFSRTLSMRQAFISWQVLLPLGFGLLFSLPRLIIPDDLSVSWIELLILFPFLGLAIGSAIGRRNSRITIDSQEVQIRDVFWRRKTISTPTITHVEAAKAGPFVKVLEIHHDNKKKRVLSVRVPDPEEAAATIRRALIFFSS